MFEQPFDDLLNPIEFILYQYLEAESCMLFNCNDLMMDLHLTFLKIHLRFQPFDDKMFQIKAFDEDLTLIWEVMQLLTHSIFNAFY